jgi:hypothetical protein
MKTPMIAAAGFAVLTSAAAAQEGVAASGVSMENVQALLDQEHARHTANLLNDVAVMMPQPQANMQFTAVAQAQEGANEASQSRLRLALR